MRDRGLKLVVATSASQEDLSAILKILKIENLLDDKTNANDASSSKPDPDLVLAALGRLGLEAHAALMIGDTPYDKDAASRAGVSSVAVRSGGWSDEALQGALAIYDGTWAILERFESSPFADRRKVA
jgi:phosphoglycolate phosphatase-like HAD superfamily hydrolase